MEGGEDSRIFFDFNVNYLELRILLTLCCWNYVNLFGYLICAVLDRDRRAVEG